MTSLYLSRVALEVPLSTTKASGQRYELSFTTGGLLQREAGLLVPLYLTLRDWNEVRETAVENNTLQARTHSTGVRRVREVLKRMSTLSEKEIAAIPDLTTTDCSQLMWAAACRRYALIGAFAEEVLRERFLTLAGTVSYDDYDSFYRTQAAWHDELNGVTAPTYRKLRQNVFRMLKEAEFLSPAGLIEPALLSTQITEFLNRHQPSDVRFFPTRTF